LLSDQAFSWQHGYGVFSVDPNQIARVAEYIHSQKQHHAEDQTWLSWEMVPEEADLIVSRTASVRQ
jgi:hypothetical protein